MGEFFHALRVFGDDLAAVKWQYLAIALALHLLKLVFRAVAWRTILRASYPDQRVGFWPAFGAYAAGVGINSVAPARGGDVVKLYLIKHRIPDSSYATLTPTLLVETLADFVIATALIVWALAIGALPAHEVYSRLPSVDWGFFIRHREETTAALFILAAIGLFAFFHFAQRGSELRQRVARGFAVLHQPRRFAFGVVLPQLGSWVLRIASMYYFLLAFGVNATVHNALLAQVVDSLATLFPATPGGAGTKQGLIVFLFAGEAVDKSLLLAFSVGMNVALVVFNLIVGLTALFLMARTLRWKRIKVAQAQEERLTQEEQA
jgi:glycosyltransferase 2 family protein